MNNKTVRLNYKTKEILTDETVDKNDLELMVTETSLALQTAHLATQKEIATIKKELEEICTTYPLDIQRYIKLKEELESFKSGIVALDELSEKLNLE